MPLASRETISETEDEAGKPQDKTEDIASCESGKIKDGADDMTEEEEKKEKMAKDATEAEKKEKEAKDAAEEKEKEEKAAKDAAEEEEKKKKEAEDAKAGMDAAIDAAVEKRTSGLFKSMAKQVAARDAVAREVSAVVGTFDHAELTADECFAYGLEKAGIKVPAGQEAAAWTGFMAGRPKSGVTLAFDSKTSAGGELVNKTLAACK